LEGPCEIPTLSGPSALPLLTLGSSLYGFTVTSKIKPTLMKFKGTGYEYLANGNIPDECQTNLKWFEDVDHLYGVLQVSGDHWVAFHVDLKKEKIDSYNPIIGHVAPES